MSAGEPSKPPDSVEAAWAYAYYHGLDSLRSMAEHLESGTPLAWAIHPNHWPWVEVMLQWMAKEVASGRKRSPGTVTEENVEGIRRLNRLARDALAGRPPSPDLLPLVEKTMIALYGEERAGIPTWAEIFKSPKPERRPLSPDELSGLEEVRLEESTDHLDWALTASECGPLCLRALVLSIERGDTKLPIEPQAWENTMTAVECLLTEHIKGRLESGAPYSPDDLERVRRLHALGAETIAGGERAPELGPLADKCLSLLMSEWRAILSKLPVCYPLPEGYEVEPERGRPGPP